MLLSMSQYSAAAQKQSVIHTVHVPSSGGADYTFPVRDFIDLLSFPPSETDIF